MDLEIADTGHVDTATVGDAFVIEYSDVRVLGSGVPVDVEIKLWKDGSIDLLYGANPADPGDGRFATVGIEDADGGDALQVGFFEDNLASSQAIRITRVPTGRIAGTITDANSGLPVAGAQVTVSPGGRRTTSGADGTYTLRARPGAYTVTASSPGYVDATASVSVADGDTTTLDLALTAPVAAVDRSTIAADVAFGATTSEDVTLRNDGSSPLTWSARERDRGVIRPPLPKITTQVHRPLTWGPAVVPKSFPRVRASTLASASLSTIINDPAGDAQGAVDVTTVRAGSDGSTVLVDGARLQSVDPHRRGGRVRLPRHRRGPRDGRPGE